MPAVGVTTSLLQTKLYRPALTEDYLPRQRLRDRLEQIVRKPLTIVSAPAGYGKSTLISAWLEQSGCSGAWLSLDENDNDVLSFTTYLVAAIGSQWPGFGEDILTMLGGPNPPQHGPFVQLFCSELDHFEEEIVLVLDDYGIISNAAVHTLVSELLVHPHPRFHLTLLTRHDPPLPLSDWRARNQIIEIRSAELRFSLEETTSFLQRAAGMVLADAAIASLNEKTEGWAAGLRLAALSLTRIEGFQDQIEALSGSNMYIMDYLLTQVFDRLPAEMQSFLVQSSVLDRLSAPLCQAMMDTEIEAAHVQTMLQELETANIFIIPLDDLRQWHRYHHLFRQFLQMRLEQAYSPREIATLHRRASDWFAAKGLIEEALQHMLATSEVDSALQLVAANRHMLIDQESYRRLSRWLQMFPQEVVEGSPDLLLIQARFAQTARFEIGELYQLVRKVDALIEQLDLEAERSKLLLAENDALRAAALFYIDPDPQASLTSCTNALEILPRDWYVIRSYCWMFGAVALQMMGNHSGAYEWIRRGRREDLVGRDQPLARNAFAEGFVCLLAADLTGLQHIGTFILGVTSKSGYWETQGWANHFLASVHYHRNDLESAQRHAQQTFNHRYYHPSANIESACILALIEQARGRPQEAREVLKTALDYAAETRSMAFTYVVQSFQAELAVIQGRAREYMLWAEQAYDNLYLTPVVSFYAPALTIPKVLLAADTADARLIAADALHRIHEYAERMHHTRVMIEVLALEAMLHAANDDEEAALAALEESLALAQPGGFIRLYVDLGSKIAILLSSMQNRGLYGAYIAAILTAFPDAAATGTQPSKPWQLIEPLTEREEEVLGLLAKRYTNREIADQLFISTATVKRHTINIYQKLSVHKRREAVEAAKTLGLIPLS